MSHPQIVEQTVRQATPGASGPEPLNAAETHTPAVRQVTPVEPRSQETVGQPAPLDRRRSSSGRRVVLRWILPSLKRLATLAIALIAIIMALVTWDYYVTAPWTRDGRVRVQVASVTPQVSGQISELRVGDNQTETWTIVSTSRLPTTSIVARRKITAKRAAPLLKSASLYSEVGEEGPGSPTTAQGRTDPFGACFRNARSLAHPCPFIGPG
jgi:hypothetical protein